MRIHVRIESVDIQIDSDGDNDSGGIADGIERVLRAMQQKLSQPSEETPRWEPIDRDRTDRSEPSSEPGLGELRQYDVYRRDGDELTLIAHGEVGFNLLDKDTFKARLPTLARGEIYVEVTDAEGSNTSATHVFDDSDDPDAQAARKQALVEEGRQAFGAFVRQWVSNFENKEGPQPDRLSAMMTMVTGYGRACEAYIRSRGGLAGAVIDRLVQENLCAIEEAAMLGKRMALNMVQVGSTCGAHLDRLLERSMYKRDLDNKPPGGGPAGDSIDFTPPADLPHVERPQVP